MKAVRIGNLAGHIKRQDCASAVWQYLVSAKKAFHEKTALGGSFALADNVFICSKISDPDWQFQDGLPLVFRKRGTLSSFRISRLREWCGIFRSITLGGSTGLSQSPAPGRTVADDNGQRIIEQDVPVAYVKLWSHTRAALNLESL